MDETANPQDAASLRKQVAVDMLMVTQGDVDPAYAWQAQDEEVRQELLEQADAAIARIVSELDLAARLLPASAHTPGRAAA